MTLELNRWLSEQNIEFALEYNTASDLGLPGEYDDEQLFSDAELVIVLGGDGAILRAVHLMGEQQLPILGVNMGQLGFLTEITASQLMEVLPGILGGKYPVIKRSMLSAALIKDGKEYQHFQALNEIVVNKHESATLALLEVWINSEEFFSYKCDSLIIATSTGSTAYSLSAGGPLVSPEIETVIITPVCPHSFFARSIILANDDILEVRPAEINQQYCIYIDGHRQHNRVFDSLSVRISPISMKLIKIRSNSFFDSVRSKLIK